MEIPSDDLDNELCKKIVDLEAGIQEERRKNRLLEEEIEKLNRSQDDVEDDEPTDPSVSVLKLQEVRHLQWRRSPAYWEPEEKLKDKEKEDALDRALHSLAERDRELELMRTSSQANAELLKAEIRRLKESQLSELSRIRTSSTASKSGKRTKDEEITFLEQQLAVMKAEKEKNSATASSIVKEMASLKEEKVKIVRRLNDYSAKIKSLLPLEGEVAELKKLLEESKKVITKLLDMQASGSKATDTSDSSTANTNSVYLEQQVALLTAERDAEKAKAQRVSTALEMSTKSNADMNSKLLNMERDFEKKLETDLQLAREEFNEKSRQEIDASKRVNAALLDLAKETSNNLQHQLEQSDKDHKEKTSKLQDTIHTLELELEACKKELELARKESSETQRELDHSAGERESLKKEIEQLKLSLRDSQMKHKNDVDSLERKLLTSEQTLWQREEDLKRSEEQAEERVGLEQKKRQELHDKLSTTTKQLAERDTELIQYRKCKEELATVSAKLSSTESERDDWKFRLQEQEVSAGGVLGQQDQRIKQMIIEQKRLEQLLNLATDERTQALHKLESIQASLVHYQEELAAKSQELDTVTEDMERISNQLHREKTRVVQLEREVQTAQTASLEQQRAEVFMSEMQAERDARITSLSIELTNLSHELESEARRSAGVLSELSDVKEERDSLRAQVGGLKDQLMEKESALTEALQNVSLLQEQVYDTASQYTQCIEERERIYQEERDRWTAFEAAYQNQMQLQVHSETTAEVTSTASLSGGDGQEGTVPLGDPSDEGGSAEQVQSADGNTEATGYWQGASEQASNLIAELQMQLQWTVEALEIERSRADVAEQTLQAAYASYQAAPDQPDVTNTLEQSSGWSDGSHKGYPTAGNTNVVQVTSQFQSGFNSGIYGVGNVNAEPWRKVPLLELRLREALYLQYASAIRQRVSGLYWQQTERVKAVIGSLEILEVNAVELKKLVEELERQFFEERRLAQVLATQFDKAWINIRGEILATVEPEMDLMEEIFNGLPLESLRSLTRLCEAINESIGYTPGTTVVKQEFEDRGEDTDGGDTWRLYTLRVEACTLLPELSRLVQAIGSRVTTPVCIGESRLKCLSRCFETTFSELQGDYSLLVDIASAWLEFDSVEALQNCLLLITRLAAARKESPKNGRTDPVSLESKTLLPVPPFTLLAVKNRLNPDFDARQYSAGYRDCFVNLRLDSSRYPTHIVELQLRLAQFTAPAKLEAGHSMVSEGDFWPIRLFQASRTLKLFEVDIRSHVGPVTPESAKFIRNGQVSSVQLDHFPYSSAGGRLFAQAANECTLGTLTSVSVQKTCVTDGEFISLVNSLKKHQRMRVLRAGGAADTIGEIRTLPWEIFTDLKQLIELDLSFNSVSGPLPTYISSCFPSLQKLVLHCNLISGPLPSDLGNLSHIKHLVLSRNRFTGPIPTSLGKLVMLKDLQLWQNQLSGPIPSELGQLSHLVRLSLDNCNLSGPLPTSLGALTNLLELHVFDNQLTGPIPPEYGNLSSLVFLGLNGNQLTGPIPVELCKLSKLQKLYLHSNQLTGSIPKDVSRLKDLVRLSLRCNKLSGELPPELVHLDKLRALTISENEITGVIPEDLGRLTKMEALSLAGNKLTGPIPISIRDMRSLRTLELQHNKLSGSIPPSLGHLSMLDQLLLNHNELTGEIPATLGELVNLSILELQNNKLEGYIPMQLCNLSKLTALTLNKNKFLETKRATYFLQQKLPDCSVEFDNDPNDKSAPVNVKSMLKSALR